MLSCNSTIINLIVCTYIELTYITEILHNQMVAIFLTHAIFLNLPIWWSHVAPRCRWTSHCVSKHLWEATKLVSKDQRLCFPVMWNFDNMASGTKVIVLTSDWTNFPLFLPWYGESLFNCECFSFHFWQCSGRPTSFFVCWSNLFHA